jgi:hypothetical protein
MIRGKFLVLALLPLLGACKDKGESKSAIEQAANQIREAANGGAGGAGASGGGSATLVPANATIAATPGATAQRPNAAGKPAAPQAAPVPAPVILPSHMAWECSSPFYMGVGAKVFGFSSVPGVAIEAGLEINGVGRIALRQDQVLNNWIDRSQNRYTGRTRVCTDANVAGSGAAKYVLEIHAISPALAGHETMATLTRYRGQDASRACNNLGGLLEYDQRFSLQCRSQGRPSIENLIAEGRNPAPAQDTSFGNTGILKVTDVSSLASALGRPVDTIGLPSATRPLSDGSTLVQFSGACPQTGNQCEGAFFININADGSMNRDFGRGGAMAIQIPERFLAGDHRFPNSPLRTQLIDFHVLADRSVLALMQITATRENPRNSSSLVLLHLGRDGELRTDKISGGAFAVRHKNLPNIWAHPQYPAKLLVSRGNEEIWVLANFQHLRQAESPQGGANQRQRSPEPPSMIVTGELIQVGHARQEPEHERNRMTLMIQMRDQLFVTAITRANGNFALLFAPKIEGDNASTIRSVNQIDLTYIEVEGRSFTQTKRQNVPQNYSSDNSSIYNSESQPRLIDFAAAGVIYFSPSRTLSLIQAGTVSRLTSLERPANRQAWLTPNAAPIVLANNRLAFACTTLVEPVSSQNYEPCVMIYRIDPSRYTFTEEVLRTYFGNLSITPHREHAHANQITVDQQGRPRLFVPIRQTNNNLAPLEFSAIQMR